ncbi:hypothetical protein EST38_g9935 [Candolleomyces aberdarensis]|uniref:Citrate transporter-like domain-containing protein n=1 Tax=Candolleomyces aberdarensis TaxID=2316362 RepID=A0A4Q2DBZ1_9AGAR|nr:hypothetical protein EST38_g9935 [Candolleomyces aberdarensis]
MVTPFAIVTFIFFLLSGIFVIRSLSFHVRLPFVGERKVTVGLKSAPIIAIAILWASQCLGATQIRDGIIGTDNIKPYNILILFISLAYMTTTLDITGILQAAAFWVSNKGGSSGRKLYFYFYLLFTLISMTVGNDPVILSGTVFLAYYTVATGLPPEAWLISEFAAANTASMVLFVGNPTNVVICEGFQINNAAFTAYMIWPFIACSIAGYLVLTLQFRNEQHIPRNLNISGYLNPREILQDRVSAVFGSIWLATCLIVVIVLSSFHVDVWKIVLPFAAGKFIFDICWDHHRYSTGKIPKFNESEPSHVGSADDPMATAFRRVMCGEMQRTGTMTLTDTIRHHDLTENILRDEIHHSTSPGESTQDISNNEIRQPNSSTLPFLNSVLQRAPLPNAPPDAPDHQFVARLWRRLSLRYKKLAVHFPTFFTAVPRLPFRLVPFAFSQFILIEALEHQGWIDIFARWLVVASNKKTMPVVWLVGIFCIILCNISGTNIGATILFTKIVRASAFPERTARAASVSLAVASNIGAVSFTFSASLTGLLWEAVLKDKGITIKQWKFAMWNTLPLLAMTGVGLGVVSAMMAVLH